LIICNIRLKYQIIEWGDDTAEADVEKMKAKAAELMEIAVVVDDGTAKATDERVKYRSGRLYFPGFVQSFEVSQT
jgi:hypothetical protein